VNGGGIESLHIDVESLDSIRRFYSKRGFDLCEFSLPATDVWASKLLAETHSPDAILENHPSRSLGMKSGRLSEAVERSSKSRSVDGVNLSRMRSLRMA
jgi:hypothetical protein